MFPLTFRLELLENAFSLLFVTHNNLRRDARDDEDATDAEDDARSEDPHSPTGSNNRVHQEGNQTAGADRLQKSPKNLPVAVFLLLQRLSQDAKENKKGMELIVWPFWLVSMPGKRVP